jgi:hypothetical protein
MSSSVPPLLGPGFLGPRRNPKDLLPGEGNIEQEAAEIFEDSERWLSTEHALLGGKRPRDCIGAADEQAVRDLLRTIRRVGIT